MCFFAFEPSRADSGNVSISQELPVGRSPDAFGTSGLVLPPCSVVVSAYLFSGGFVQIHGCGQIPNRLLVASSRFRNMD